MAESDLKTMGAIAGVAGLALGFLLLVYKDIIGKKIFRMLTKPQAFKLLMMIILLVST